MPKLDLDLVRHALSVARANGFVEVEIGVGADSFSAKLEPKAATKPVKKGTSEAPAAATDGDIDVRAQLVGYFRHAKHRVEVGSQVQKGDVIGMIAALGIANDIEAPESGEVTQVLVEHDQPVEYGQSLVRIKP